VVFITNERKCIGNKLHVYTIENSKEVGLIQSGILTEPRVKSIMGKEKET
jgi:hypothetical protein